MTTAMRAAQARYDAMTPEDPLEYRESQHYLDWLSMVTERIVSGDESYGIDPCEAIAVGDVHEYVFERIDDKHYFTYVEDQQDYD